MDDVDFKTKVTRAKLEAMCADMMPRWTQPIYDALAMANLTMVCCLLYYFLGEMLNSCLSGRH